LFIIETKRDFKRGTDMSYLNNNQIVVDAVLTKKGRELLAKG
jgi:hypothetical protein